MPKPRQSLSGVNSVVFTTSYSHRRLPVALGLAVMLSLSLVNTAFAARAPTIPTVTIAGGVELPMAGLGTWQYNDTRAEGAVKAALALGYTHIDTAYDCRPPILAWLGLVAAVWTAQTHCTARRCRTGFAKGLTLTFAAHCRVARQTPTPRALGVPWRRARARATPISSRPRCRVA
eukprot:3801681-Prymnesium_polylepis.2